MITTRAPDGANKTGGYYWFLRNRDNKILTSGLDEDPRQMNQDAIMRCLQKNQIFIKLALYINHTSFWRQLDKFLKSNFAPQWKLNCVVQSCLAYIRLSIQCTCWCCYIEGNPILVSGEQWVWSSTSNSQKHRDILSYGMVWFHGYSMVFYGIIWSGMVHYVTIWYGMVHYGILWFDQVPAAHCGTAMRRCLSIRHYHNFGIFSDFTAANFSFHLLENCTRFNRYMERDFLIIFQQWKEKRFGPKN